MKNDTLIKIIITEKDLEKHKPKWKSSDGKEYPHSYSASGILIDELAYASKQWTSEEMYENNFEYDPYEPYEYNYEHDLFLVTKTPKKLYALAKILGVSINANWERLSNEQGLQAGACVALNNPEEWKKLLQAYKEKLQQDGTGGISEEYNKQLQKEKDSYSDYIYRQWLYGDRDYAGVIREIQRHFGAEDAVYHKKNNDCFIFFFDREQAKETLECNGKKLTIKNFTFYLINEIVVACKAREYKEKQEAQERKAERERLAQHKKEQEQKKEEERKKMLLSMKQK